MSARIVAKRFDVHGLVRVRLESAFPAKVEQVLYQLREFEHGDGADSDETELVLRDYAAAPPMGSWEVVSDAYRYAAGQLDWPPYRIRFDLLGAPITVFCDRLGLPLNLLVHLALLRRGFALLHAAGVEYRGRRYLFPALGGVGKTAIVADLVFSGGRLFGDDLTIVGPDQLCSYPIDFSVYPYHVQLLRLGDRLIERAFRRTAAIERLTKRLERFDSRPLKLARVVLNSLKVPCVNVPPRRIFGDHCFASQGTVDAVYHLVRVGDDAGAPTMIPADPAALTRACANTLLYEWQAALPMLALYSTLSSFSLEDMLARTRAIFERLFATRPCHTISMAGSLTVAQCQAAVRARLGVGP